MGGACLGKKKSRAAGTVRGVLVGREETNTRGMLLHCAFGMTAGAEDISAR